MRNLARICPCESIFRDDLVPVINKRNIKETELYMIKVYNWVERNFGLKIEELKSSNLLVRSGDRDSCFKEE